jgi:hypothetical protein
VFLLPHPVPDHGQADTWCLSAVRSLKFEK